MVRVDLTGAERFYKAEPDIAAAEKAFDTLVNKTGKGADFTGWLELPQRIKDTELDRIVAAAEKIRSRSKALVVIGIGGSYLGARGAIELLKPLPGKDDPKVFFAGNGVSADGLCAIIEQLGDKDFDVNVISKSGTTLEPAISFRIFRELLHKKYGEKANEHIFMTTDEHKGALKQQGDKFGWEAFIVPDDVGGRFSVLSAVGLLPMAVAGIDVRRVIDTAIAELAAYKAMGKDSPAFKYAAARQQLYKQGYGVEILACYEPSFRFMGEWWKQLYGESEGKDGIGIFPASVEYTADLHSMGQYIQDGVRDLMETVVRFKTSHNSFAVPNDEANADGLNYLSGRDLTDICATVAEAVKEAHISGGVPNMVVELDRRDEVGFAELVTFFEFACGVSGYISGVNPFDQPGVEAYKKNMFHMLGKPGC
ncbi:MAG: glucose-6-phosphate isomerase [Oscillospiraceae bacterium]|nr:glucose-6-phosphate isomerase [Oscillospiraceae bacterium]